MSTYLKGKEFTYVVDDPRIEPILTRVKQVLYIYINVITKPLIELGN